MKFDSLRRMVSNGIKTFALEWFLLQAAPRSVTRLVKEVHNNVESQRKEERQKGQEGQKIG